MATRVWAGRAAVLALVAGAVTAPPGLAATAEDVRSDADVRLDGAAEGDDLGYSVAVAGDVNGDGWQDVAVAAPGAGHNGRPGSGSVYVVFGGRSLHALDLAAFGPSDGFRIDGAQAGAEAGRAVVAAAGDVNRDGLDDVVVGQGYAAGACDGAAYVVFGKPDGGPVDLAAFGLPGNTRGFRVVGLDGNPGFSVAGGGDVNGDGRSDVVVGAPFTRGPTFGAGAAYVVFGKDDYSTVNVDVLGTNGFRIAGVASSPPRYTGWTVTNAGDVDGDGLDDVALGQYFFNGSAYVVFGKASSTPVDLAAIGTDAARGFRIDGTSESVAGAGDVNGDGLADVAIGAARAAFVVHGSASTAPVALGALGPRGVKILLRTSLQPQVAGAGDVNGDGRPDVVVGEFGSRAWVVFTGPTNEAIDTRSPSFAGLALTGIEWDGITAFRGPAVGGGADVTGDGRADVLVGANARAGTGAAYVVGVHRPDCSAVVATPGELASPDGEVRLVGVSGATDRDGDEVALAVTGVTQDEALGDTTPDAVAGGTPATVQLRAERDGRGDGRVYRVAFTATDATGEWCAGTVPVGVRRWKSTPAVDSGLVVDSFGG
jgi:hypothetical protein